MTEYLFVYGTLRKKEDHPLYRLIESTARFEGRARFAGQLYDTGPYPAAVADPQAHPGVVGELYGLTAPERLFPLLDRYEGCTDDDEKPHEYRREKHTVVLENGSSREAWLYVYNHPTLTLRPIPSGDYLNR